MLEKFNSIYNLIMEELEEKDSICSAADLKDLEKLKNQIEWMKNNWAPDPRTNEDYQIISDLFEKSSSLTYSELKEGLEKIEHSDMLRSMTYGRFRMAVHEFLTKLEK